MTYTPPQEPGGQPEVQPPVTPQPDLQPGAAPEEMPTFQPEPGEGDSRPLAGLRNLS